MSFQQDIKPKLEKFFKNLSKFIGNNDFTNMMKNNDKGFSMKKFAAMMILVTFCHLQYKYWSEANGIAMLGIDASLITSILITNAVQQGKIPSSVQSKSSDNTGSEEPVDESKI